MKLREEFPQVMRCYQCSSCTLGCPTVEEMGLKPNEIIRAVILGMDEEALKSKTPWICTSCEACATRCPNGIEIVKIMDLIRRRAFEWKITQEKEPKFHRAFLRQIKKHGRVHDLSVAFTAKRLQKFKISKKEIKFAWQMFLKGKLKLFPSKTGEDLEKLFQSKTC